MKKMLAVLAKGVLVLAGVIACLMALTIGMFYMSVRPKELSPSEARNSIRLEPGDEVPKRRDVDELPSAVVVDVNSPRHNHGGDLNKSAKDRGLNLYPGAVAGARMRW